MMADASKLKQWRYVICDDDLGSHVDTIIRRVRNGQVQYYCNVGKFDTFHAALVAVYKGEWIGNA